MNIQTGLKDRARFEAFSREWREEALKEAKKWCANERAQELLADAVLAEFQKKYADSAPPSSMDYQIRAQVCLVYSLTGNNVRKLKNYIAEHSLPPEAEEPASIVIYILSPVSPSGIGKTLRSFIVWRFCARRAAPPRTRFR